MAKSANAVLHKPSATDLAKVVYRKARKSDLKELARLDQEIYAVEGGWSYENFVDDFAAADRYYLVATFEEQIIAYAACCIERRVGHLTMNTVLPQWRGLGIGRIMIEKRLTWLDKRVRKVLLQTHCHNDIVKDSYLKYGFVPTKILTGYYDTGTDAQEMCRRLPAKRTKKN